eukprot:29380-Pelagococcus_subviridis.AAC.17
MTRRPPWQSAVFFPRGHQSLARELARGEARPTPGEKTEACRSRASRATPSSARGGTRRPGRAGGGKLRRAIARAV